jgi:CheY-like chemotaxis protein
MQALLPRFAGRVLLVEDNAVNAIVARTTLEGLGVDVEVACDGVEALDRLRSEPFDLVLMDIHMPRMDGYTAARTWRAEEANARRARVPIVALTANALPVDRQKSLDVGMDEHVSKPYTNADLATIMLRYLPLAS